MQACLTVICRKKMAVVSAVTFKNWESDQPLERFVQLFEITELPEENYSRQLYCFKKMLRRIRPTPKIVLLNAPVDLPDGNPGPGRFFFDEFRGIIPVIGVNRFALKDLKNQFPVIRGGASRPAYVSVAGIEEGDAAAVLKAMHGNEVLPYMMKLSVWLAESYHV